MKRIITIAMVVLMLLGLSGNLIFADEVIKVSVNGSIVNFDNPPVVKDGRTLVPLRKIFEALNATVVWEAETETVVATKGDTTMRIPLNSKTAEIQRIASPTIQVNLEVPAQIIGSRTYVPVRFIGESLGEEVSWDGSTRTVVIGIQVSTSTVIEYSDARYEGETKNGLPHGYGIQIWENGDRCEGDFYEGILHGHVKYTWVSQNAFEGQYIWGDMSTGVLTSADGQVFNTDENGQIIGNNTQNTNDFKTQAKQGASYSQLMKNSFNYIDTPCYFEGKVIQAIEDNNGSSFFLIDTSALYNALGESYGMYEDPELVAIFSDSSKDIFEDDYLYAYGRVMERFTYEDVYGYVHTVPSMKLVDYEITRDNLMNIVVD